MAQSLFGFLKRNRYPVLAAVVVLAAGGIYLASQAWQARQPHNPTPQPIPSAGSQGSGAAAIKSGGLFGMGTSGPNLPVRLSAGKAQAHLAAPVPLATGEPLTPAEIAALLSRLPDLPAQPGDQTDFNLPGGPIPPPRTGETIPETFPPAPEAVAPEAVPSGPLEVLRFSPEGEIPVAPFLSVTFNQPMVPLATVEALAASEVPVRLEPALPGTWRWLGTRTLTFQSDSTQFDRLPKATEYTVTVPAGTKSQSGGELAQDVTWTFSTPPVKVVSTYPNSAEPQPLDPLFFIQFDQRVDPGAILEIARVTAGGKAVAVHPVDEAEIKGDEKQAYLLDNVPQGRWVAFRANDPLPADTQVDVTLPAGLPSAEGPRVTDAAQSYSFRTYAALKVVDHGCYWGNNQCVPLAPFFIRFNNPIDPAAYDPAMLTITPELPGANATISWDTLQIQGNSKGQTTYTITISADLQDTFGQKLGQDVRLSFKVGPAEPSLYITGSNLVTLDPASKKPAFSVFSINYPRLEVTVQAVQPSDWPAFVRYLEDYRRTDQLPALPGRQVLQKTLPVEAAADTLTETAIDLTQLMDGPYGHFIVVVKPPAELVKDPQSIRWQTIQSWVEITQIGLDAFTDQSDMVVWTSALKDGAPLSGVTVTAGDTGIQATTGADGTARFPIPAGASYLVASQGADQALLPRSPYPWSGDAWQPQPADDELRWFVFDDRQMYRPGEEVHVKGWLRRVGAGPEGDVGPVSEAVTGVSYTLQDSQGNDIGSGQADVNALGGFDLAFTLPEQLNLGYTQLQLAPSGNLVGLGGQPQTYTHAFQVQEFRRPEFEVTARNETPGPYFAGGNATVAVKAAYYAGGPLPGADVTWQVSTTGSHYDPPGWPGFTFGEWTPWWFAGGRGYALDYYAGPPGPNPNKIETFTGQTDASGEHYLQLDFGQPEAPQPVSVIAQATVMDVNRQAWTGSTTLLVHPASLYVGLRSDRMFVDRGTPLRVDYIVTDLDGKAAAGVPVEVRAARLEWKFKAGSWQEVEADVQTCQQTSGSEPATCTFETPTGGTYQITAVVSDDQGRSNQSRLTRWVSGGQLPPQRNVEQETVTLIPDKETYAPGEVARVLVLSPFSPAEGLLTINRSGIVETRRFAVADGSATLEIPVEEGYTPNLALQVDLNGSAPRTDDQGSPLADVPRRPAFATGQITLKIPPVRRTLSLEVAPVEAALAPGSQTSVDVVVKDADGQPVPDAELSVIVVDEAILALSGYDLADPLSIFYADRPLILNSTYLRSSLVLANPQSLTHNAQAPAAMATAPASEGMRNMELAAGAAAPAQPTSAPAMAQDMAKNGLPGQVDQPIQMRLDFNPLAVFAPAVHTDAEGRATVQVKLPDNLTRYRIMVAAVAQGTQFGKGEANLTARLPLMVRPSAPRFLNFGDRFELPVVLQNQTDQPLTVDVAARASNLELTGDTGLRVTVPANDRVEVRFAAAAQMAGAARIQVAAVSGSYADAATVDLPVYTPATTEAFATYGVIDAGAIAQPVAAPQDVFPQYGGLEITTSSTAVQALTDAVLYLVSYPYDCSEQIASRILGIAALRDVLAAFKAEGLPSPEELQASVDRDIQTLKGIQNDDGGFPYWRRGDESIPFNTIHVAHALYRAQSKGFDVPGDVQARLLDYLRQIESHYPAYYTQETRHTLSAYALYVRSLMGDKDPTKALKLLDEAGGPQGLSLDATGWLWPVLSDAPEAGNRLAEIRRYVANRVVETAGAANFTTTYDDQNYLLLGSDRRTDAILLDALIGDDPQSDLIPKVVNGLLAHRTRGRWGNTQENVFVLLALDRYFNTYEAQTPDFVARLWLGETYAGSQDFQGRSTDRHELDIPMRYLTDTAQGGTQDLVLSKEGAGRLYYRLGLRYAPTSLEQAALDMGFSVQRVYEAVDDPADVRQDEAGAWHIKAGARVRVRLTLVADNRRYHVALSDPLPAGLEIVNPDLAVSATPPPDPNQPPVQPFWWWGPWYDHQNLRDERAEAFATLLWDGVYQYSYIARATTPGTFVVPPAKAEEMYSPEVFGRSASDKVIVE